MGFVAAPWPSTIGKKGEERTPARSENKVHFQKRERKKRKEPTEENGEKGVVVGERHSVTKKMGKKKVKRQTFKRGKGALSCPL